jgi:phospholipid/cholesterol/gamma-HCH transport system ATP-binding protein
MVAETTSILVVKHLHTAFGSKTVHKNVSFSLHKAECLALVGGSGSGKSVLLRTLIGLDRPAGGECFFRERNLYALEENEWTEVRKSIAYAFQGGALFDSLSVHENLSYPLREHTTLSDKQIDEKVDETLKRFNLEDAGQLLPGSLSGGMQKRVGLARAIMMDPEIILYDEPTAGLDPYNTRKIAEMILQLKELGKSSILVTHDMPTAMQVADRIALLFRGNIADIQEVEHIRKSPKPAIAAFMTGEEIPLT